MRKRLTAMVWMGMAAAIVLGGPARARADEIIVVTVPFDFMAGNSRFPAGRYEVTDSSNPGVVSIQSADRVHRAFVMTIPDASEKTETPALVFERVGAEHFLARIVSVDGESREISLTPTSLERELEGVD